MAVAVFRSRSEDWRARLRGVRELSSAASLSRVRPQQVPALLAALLGDGGELPGLAADRNARVAAAALDAAGRLATAAAAEREAGAAPWLALAVRGVGRRAGAGNQLAVRVAAAGAARRLTALPGAAPHVARLAVEDAARQVNAKARESALLVALYAATLQPPPSPPPEADALLEAALELSLDGRRRVRQAALELAAAAAARADPRCLEAALRGLAESRSPAAAAAARARLARPQLPAPAPDGLLRYGLHLPRGAAAFAAPQGADVSWILSGSGALSAGSVRAPAQSTTASSSGSSDCGAGAAGHNVWADRRRTLSWASVAVVIEECVDEYFTDSAKTWTRAAPRKPLHDLRGDAGVESLGTAYVFPAKCQWEAPGGRSLDIHWKAPELTARLLPLATVATTAAVSGTVGGGACAVAPPAHPATARCLWRAVLLPPRRRRHVAVPRRSLPARAARHTAGESGDPTAATAARKHLHAPSRKRTN
ncbi:uncharacterized protein LOC126278915 [Schistocerca gregaria]|uniref:uncharacterized protein LOC126278915 n=1 Tax=Schistocerca gregaria TaxID=7010 RepID=UPI00211E0228|nr:uncharacterized protein LOC126278915 [Schistocerca gregaria]